MSNKKTPLGFYIELDTILDTRLGSLYLLDKKKAIEMIENTYNNRCPKGHLYYSRYEDNFEFAGFNQNDYKELYSNRDREVLKNSTITNILPTLKSMLMDLLDKLVCHPLHDSLEVYLNIYPYTSLKPSEVKMIQRAVNYHIGGFGVRLIKKSPQELTVQWLLNHVRYFYLYDYPLWLNTSGLALKEKKATELTMYAPMLFFGGLPTEQEIQEFRAKTEMLEPNYFLVMHDIYRSLIKFNFLPIDHFCIGNDYYEQLLAMQPKKETS